MRRIDSIRNIQSSAMEILSRQESSRRLQTQQANPDVRDNVINELLNWKDDNIQKLLSNLDSGSASRMDDYEDIRERMSRLWGAASRYKGLSHAEMEDVLAAFSAEVLTPQMLDQISGDEDLRQAFQKVAVTKIPRQMEKLFASLTSLLQNMRLGSVPSVEEEERVLREAQSVMLTCSTFQSVVQPSSSDSFVRLQQALQRSDSTPSSTERDPGLLTSPPKQEEQPLPDRPRHRFSKATEGKAEEKVEQTASGGAVSPQVLSPTSKLSSLDRRDRGSDDHASRRTSRVPTTTASTQTDPQPPEPISELTGQKMRVFDMGEVRRQAKSR